jgi:hypothetical protein
VAKRNAYCLLPHDAPTDVRGSRNAPRPAGDDTGGPPYAPEGRSGTGTRGAVAHGVPVTGADGSSLPSVQGYAPYDPITGLLTLPDGEGLIIGDDGGQRRFFGADSWRWLLLAPLGG